MQVIKTKIPGLKVIIPTVWEDQRGYFYESYHADRYRENGIDCTFVQDNESQSGYGVIRGLHYQTGPYAQGKLVRVIDGEVLDVVVDIRKDSPTYGHSLSLILNDISKKQLFVPPGFAHGYAVLSETATFAYKCSKVYQPSHEGGILYKDPYLKINWMIPEKDRIISEKDQSLPLFGDHLEN